jgi:glutaminyl-tRNA synthetase
VLRPLKLVIENYPQGQEEEIEAPCHPMIPPWHAPYPLFAASSKSSGKIHGGSPKQVFRWTGRECGCAILTRQMHDVVRDAMGEIVEVLGALRPRPTETRGAAPRDGRKSRGHPLGVGPPRASREVRLYDRLFVFEDPCATTVDYKATNPDSLEVLKDCLVEPSLAGAAAESRYQFERLGYFCADRRDCAPGRLVFNRTVTLKDTWAKIEKKD